MKITKTDNRDNNITRRTHTFIYELKVENTGDVDFEEGDNLKVTDTVPSEFRIIAITSGGHVDGQNVTWNIKNLAKGEKKTLKIEVQVKSDAKLNTSICNTGKVSFEDGVRDQDKECITVEGPTPTPQVAATITPAPRGPINVPITAPTGPESMGVLASLLGMSGLGVVLKRFW